MRRIAAQARRQPPLVRIKTEHLSAARKEDVLVLLASLDLLLGVAYSVPRLLAILPTEGLDLGS